MVFFILMAFAGVFVVIHQVYDQPIVVEKVVEEEKDDDRRGTKIRKVDATGNIIVEEGEEGTTTGTGTAKGGSLAGHGVVQFTETPGTIVFYVILGIAGAALLLYLLAVHRSPSTITFAVVVVIIVAGLIFDPEDKEKDLLKDTELIALQSNQSSSIETSAPQYFSLEKINYLPNISDGVLISGTTYSIVYLAGVVLLASLLVITMLPQFNVKTKSTAMLFFLAALKNLTNVYIFGFGVLAIISTYFIGGNTFIPSDTTIYQPRIISELNIGDLSQIKYEATKRFFYETVNSGYSQVAFSILAVFLVQYFLFLNMGQKASYKRFAPYMYIVIFAGLLWSGIFYSVGYSFYKIIAVFIIGIPLTPLVWQFMAIYREKIARDNKLSQWEEVK